MVMEINILKSTELYTLTSELYDVKYILIKLFLKIM